MSPLGVVTRILHKKTAVRVRPRRGCGELEKHALPLSAIAPGATWLSERTVIWDMGLIAMTGGDRALKLFRQVLLQLHND